MSKKVIVVGGVAGGATAAARLRRADEACEIILLEKGDYISFANCGLPYYLGGVIKERDRLLLQTPEDMRRRFRVDVRVQSEAIGVDRAAKTLRIHETGTGRVYEESFDAVVFATGAKAVWPDIPGLTEAENAFPLRNIPHTDAIKDFLTEKKPKTALVAGGGFVGVEMAENLVAAGLSVTLVEKQPHILGFLDAEMASLVEAELAREGVDLRLQDSLTGFSHKGRVAKLASGEVESDLVIMSLGVRPETGYVKGAGILLEKGYFVTDKRFRLLDEETKEPIEGFYAVGDAAMVTSFVNGEKTLAPLAWPANRQGRLVADEIAGIAYPESRVQKSAVIRVFGLTAAATGENEAGLQNKGIAYHAVHAHRGNHAGYYPGASNIALKLLFEKETGRILGAMAVGREGTEKRIDVIATAMRLGAKAPDLADLELCYAPPYSSAKDPVNILGYIAENLMRKDYKNVHWDEIEAIVADGGYLLDVRTPAEYSAGHVEGSANIELDDLRARLAELPANKSAPLYVNCQGGQRSYLAICILKGNGYKNLYNLSGGYSTYRAGRAPAAPAKKRESAPLPGNAPAQTLDVSGLQCPGPIMSVYRALGDKKPGEQLLVTATDAGFACDIDSWCASNGHSLLRLDKDRENGTYKALIEKGGAAPAVAVKQESATMVLFSGALDKALAAMIIAQGAAAQGKQVTVFFTFWGLNVLRKSKGRVKKDFMGRMFGGMMPKGANKLPLSNMNMLGMGPKMIKGIMKKNKVESLPDMLLAARAAGVRFIACTMSMELMGIKEEELLEGVEFAGVATYIAANENAGTTLFI